MLTVFYNLISCLFVIYAQYVSDSLYIEMLRHSTGEITNTDTNTKTKIVL